MLLFSKKAAPTPSEGTRRAQRISRRRLCVGVLALALVVGLTGCAPSAAAGTAGSTEPLVNLQIGGQAGTELTSSLQLLFLLTALALAPAILITVTSFTRIIIVLSLIRSALGVPQMPPNQVLVGLALFLTIFVMAPVGTQINDQALQPYSQGLITQQEAFDRGLQPLRAFMLEQTREKDISLFVQMGNYPRPATPADVPIQALIPAFVISELKTAFQMGFLIFIPFLIIDMVVSSTLLSMGMMMLPPVMISLPFKLLLFIMVDGWYLIVKSVVMSFS